MGSPGGYKVCPNCGAGTPLETQQCASCGHQFQTNFAQPPPNQTQAFFNPQPSAQWMTTRPPGAPDSNRLLVTILLWFFAGQFGAHRFYLGYTQTAITMLVLECVGIATACFIVGYFFLLAVFIWWIVDLVQILLGNLRPIDGTRLL